MADDTPAPPPAPPSRVRREARWLMVSLPSYVLRVAAVLALLIGTLWWLARTDAGSAWLLDHVPGVQAQGVRGSLIGDFDAERLELTLPGNGLLRFDGIGWRQLRIESADGSMWFRIAAQELFTRRLQLRLPDSDDDTPLAAPDSLYSPVEVQVAALRIDELQHDALGEQPLRGLRAQLHLGADAGARHRIDQLALQWDRLQLDGSAAVATRGALQLDAQLALKQQLDGPGEWSASARLAGPLSAPQLLATLRAQPTRQRPAQTLDVDAVLHPFAAWPLGALNAKASALDLSALHSAAPVTALDLQAQAQTQAFDQPAALSVSLRNALAGRWNEGRLPVRSLLLELRARPDEPTQLDVQRFEAALGSSGASAGQLSGSGRWSPTQWQLDTRLLGLAPQALDARAPALALDGQVGLRGQGFGGTSADSAQVELRAELRGHALDAGAAKTVQLKLDAQASRLHLLVREALATAGATQASASGVLRRERLTAPWSLEAKVALREFDPAAWWPGRLDSPWRKGPHRLNASADLALRLPASHSGTLLQQLALLRGRAALDVQPSQLAGVPLSAQLSLQAAERTQWQLNLDTQDNRVRADGSYAAASGEHQLDLKAEAPALNRLQPLWRLLLEADADATVAGSLQADVQLSGRWPALQSSGRVDSLGLQVGAVTLQQLRARWQLGSSANAPLDAEVDLHGLHRGVLSAESVALRLKGTLAAHELSLRAHSRGLPPAWVELLQPAQAGARAGRTLAHLQLKGALRQDADAWPTAWRGRVQQLDLRGDAAGAPAWASARDIGIDAQWAAPGARLAVDAGRAELLGAALRWSGIDWRAATPDQPASLNAQVELEPVLVAPLLNRLQPNFGWGGDLRLAGHLKLRSAPDFSADVVLQRSGGDLSVSDDTGVRTLGLSDLRLGVVADAGVWSFTSGLAGTTLGVAAGAVVARTSPRALWPDAGTPIEGVLELQVGSLGVWGPWLPPGWRLNGAMRVGAAFGGRIGAPEVTGELTGKSLALRNLLQGVDVRDGDVAIALQGGSARIERFTARAGTGQISLQGQASLGDAPRAELKLSAERFQLLGRVDRRIVTSGEVALHLARDAIKLDGELRVDEGLIDFTRSDAPTLSEDVQVRRSSTEESVELEQAMRAAEASSRARNIDMKLRVLLGEQLRLRGQGLDTGLRGDLLLSAPRGQLRVDGQVRTAGGTFNAYRQKLVIDRGVLSFNGPVQNAALDIVATRPNLDVRVGVAVAGTVLVPRVRLFSDPEMSDIDKLNWLVRGRPSDSRGGADTALLQAAALALLAGEDNGADLRLLGALGIDEFSVREGDTTSGAIVSVGKQLSSNWYVGYERSVNAAAGNWQLIYRVAQRFTIRAQSGEENSIGLIWTWRWQ